MSISKAHQRTGANDFLQKRERKSERLRLFRPKSYLWVVYGLTKMDARPPDTRTQAWLGEGFALSLMQLSLCWNL